MQEFPGEQWYRLSPQRDSHGLSCDHDGAFLGPVALLARRRSGGEDIWAARSADEIEANLTPRYGAPVTIDGKLGGLGTVARALNRRNMIGAKIATVQLRIPDLPPLEKSARLEYDHNDMLARLRRAGMLKAEWDPEHHPRWPQGTAEGRGGQFRPADEVAQDTSSDRDAPLITAQAIPIPVPAPFELPLPPTEIAPFPLIAPDGMNREPVPVNSYPDRPECAEEWARAFKECNEHMRAGRFEPGRRGFGADFAQCLKGMVSQECGGNPTA